MKTRVLCCGTFDFLHPGHLYFLKQASEQGAELYVVVARDDNVNKIKGRYPTHRENERKEKVEAVDCVDNARLGYPGMNFLKVVKEINPNIIALGYDQKAPPDLKENFPLCKIVTLDSLHPDKFKSSLYRNLTPEF